MDPPTIGNVDSNITNVTGKKTERPKCLDDSNDEMAMHPAKRRKLEQVC